MDSVPRLGDIPRRLTASEFWNLFGRLEHEQLDFKRGVPTDVRDAIAAMAMTRGGLIIHGVDDGRNIVGCPLSQNTQDRITRIASECGVDVQIREIIVGGTELTICAVPEVRGRIVTTPDGRLLRRVGGDAQPIRGDAMARFVRERGTSGGRGRAASHGTGVSVRSRRGEPGARRRRPARRGAESDGPGPGRSGRGRSGTAASGAERVAGGGGSVRGRATGLSPVALPCSSCVAWVSIPDPDRLPRARSAPVRLWTPVDCCLEFLGRHTRRFESVTGTRRAALPEYPEAVLREAVVNALAHRDYGLESATVDITVWDDRIEVRSPGPLPGHITIDNMRDRALQPQPSHHAGSEDDGTGRRVRRGHRSHVPGDGVSPDAAAGLRGDRKLRDGHAAQTGSSSTSRTRCG